MCAAAVQMETAYGAWGGTRYGAESQETMKAGAAYEWAKAL